MLMPELALKTDACAEVASCLAQLFEEMYTKNLKFELMKIHTQYEASTVWVDAQVLIKYCPAYNSKDDASIPIGYFNPSHKVQKTDFVFFNYGNNQREVDCKTPELLAAIATGEFAKEHKLSFDTKRLGEVELKISEHERFVKSLLLKAFVP